MENIINSIKATLYDRAVSPLFGAFVLAWLSWNYSFILAMFSNMELHDKLTYINTFIFSNGYQCFIDGVMIPLAFTIFYIIIFPYPSLWAYKASIYFQKQLNAEKQKLYEGQLISSEEAHKLRTEYRKLREEYSELMSDKDLEINDLKKELKQQNEENNALKTENKNITKNDSLDKGQKDNKNIDIPFSYPQIDKNFETTSLFPDKFKNKSISESKELQVLVAISHDNTTEFLINSFLKKRTSEELNRARLRYYIDKLIDDNLIKVSIYDDNPENNHYLLSKQGRALLVERDIDKLFEKEFSLEKNIPFQESPRLK